MTFAADPIADEPFALEKPDSVALDPDLRPRTRPRYKYFAAGLMPTVEKLGPTQRVLEIGCGNGSLASRLGFPSVDGPTFVGLEPLAARAMGSIDLGLDVRQIPLDVFSLDESGNGSWDLIILDNVLEHMRDPGASMRLVMKLLSEDGSVAIAVPNLYDIRRYLPVRFNIWAAPDHFNYFSSKSLRRFLGEHGLGMNYLSPNTSGNSTRVRVSWKLKRLAERLFDFPARGIYVICSRTEPG